MDMIATNLVALAVLKATLGGILEDNGKSVPTYFPDYVTAIQSAGNFQNRQATTTINGEITRNKIQSKRNTSWVVSNRIYLPDATSIPNKCFENFSELREVIAPNVTTIGNNAFAGCRELKHVEFSPNLTTIGTRAFYCCNKLVNTNVYENVTTVGSQAFSYCYSMKVFPVVFDSIESMGGDAFSHCFITFMKDPEVPWNIINTSYLFQNSTLPTNIWFEEAGNVSYGGYFCKNACFAGNAPFTFLAGSSDVGCSAFYNSFVTGIDDYGAETGDLVFGDSSFRACRRLTKVRARNVASVGKFCFSGCQQLHEVNLASATKIGVGAFCKDLALTNLVLTSCVDFGTDQTGYGDQVYRSLSYRGGPFSANSGYTHANFVKASGDYAGPTYKIPLASLTLPAVQKIGVNSFGDATNYQFTDIMDLYLPNLTTAQIKAMDTYPYWFLHPSCTIHASDGNFTYGN